MLDAYRDLIDDLLSTPTEIRALVDTPGGSGTSSEAKRLVAEIRNRDRAILERVQVMTREETPYLPRIAPEPVLRTTKICPRSWTRWRLPAGILSRCSSTSL